MRKQMEMRSPLISPLLGQAGIRQAYLGLLARLMVDLSEGVVPPVQIVVDFKQAPAADGGAVVFVLYYDHKSDFLTAETLRQIRLALVEKRLGLEQALASVPLASEPWQSYQSQIRTVEQALEAVDGLP